ncbi:sugar ABC transporter ATP-binding protein [Actinobacteria bacterium YIM 96077]|uniref:Sugar ABC transporter ATP-binding protein n=1 Tax=Phytoactinopolyspora halophila TaxID=1981511 RepID=A0A329QL16_9ACTN|nr:ATP-binding cassette domain-containing protein [Phytoactinopolyspora halophila]AYY13654.1 sugar ABC transporter ATP-binding protein [Actinobacteria bacterium YIM 96077]RAW11218.1 sugar ABC transporter ATP-binding protein [Phytoactinopolyspora halophila]
MDETAPVVMELHNVSKTFGEVQALRDVNFHVRQGEIVGLLGDNGSGKSTMVKMMMGYHQPDPGGEVRFDDEPVRGWSVAKARSLGIETVYQERALADLQSVWRNMFMGREPVNRFGLLDTRRMRREAAALMKGHMGFTSGAVHPDNVVQTMSGGEKQGVAITRALHFHARLVLLDEPTMGLSLSETQKTLDFVRSIKEAGHSAVLIDHNINHVYPVVDRLVVLDRGSIAGEFSPSEITLDELTDRLRTVARTGQMEE